MKAVEVIDDRYEPDGEAFAEFSVWQLPEPLAGSPHRYKYRPAFVVDGICVLRYDNEAGKGDHKHLGRIAAKYAFSDLDQLQVDFWADVEQWRQRWERS